MNLIRLLIHNLNRDSGTRMLCALFAVELNGNCLADHRVSFKSV